MSAGDFGPLAFKPLRQQMIDDGLSRSYINDHADPPDPPAKARRRNKHGFALDHVMHYRRSSPASSSSPNLQRASNDAPQSQPPTRAETRVHAGSLPIRSEFADSSSNIKAKAILFAGDRWLS
jgi:hypothetical protein